VTKVIKGVRWELLLSWLLVGVGMQAAAQSVPPQPAPASGATSAAPSSAEALYLRLRSVGLDKTRVYHARDVSFHRDAIAISLDDGTIAFTEDVEGRVTGAFFEGDGDVLVMPPDQVERASMVLFTGAAILEEKFVTAYFRFNDDTYQELQPLLRPEEHSDQFVARWNETARNLASIDGLRLLVSFSRFLPVAGQASPPELPPAAPAEPDRMLHARVEGRNLGAFDLYYDSAAAEQVRAGQLKTVHGQSYYDLWTSFSSKRGGSSARDAGDAGLDVEEDGEIGSLNISSYKIRAVVKPPTELDVDSTLQIDVHQGGARALTFELSRFLDIQRVEADGHPVEFIHNPALEGTERARRGNDLVVVVFPQPLQAGRHLELRFVYRGEVLSGEGPGLLYVGARGTWYPNFGPAMSNFDLEFRYPAGWTLLATGQRHAPEVSPPGTSSPSATSSAAAGDQVSRWISERPIPLAGFNLGQYTHATAHAGSVVVEVYATSGMERTFPKAPATALIPALPTVVTVPRHQETIDAPPPPSPALNEQRVAEESARAVEFFARRYGPYPYGKLALTQMPGELSQGWPGLIFLSSFAFLSPAERAQLHVSSLEDTRGNLVVAHETAHQWWGDLVVWKGYRDQWIVEALAEYSSLMRLESQDPAKFRAVLESYQDKLLQKNKDGTPLMAAGPVTLGIRLSCSPFPTGYQAISYGRGTWLFHMLRTMTRDAESKGIGHRASARENLDEPFLRALRKLKERYQGKSISTRDVLRVFEEELPPSLWYEGQKSLDWFYNGWINGTAIPRLELHDVKYVERDGSARISGTIRQSEAPEDLVTLVPVYGTVGGKSVLLGQVFADGPETAFHLTAPTGTQKAVLDPYRTLLARTR
jgi:hypothetical protein